MAMHISRGLTIALIFGFSLVTLNSQAPPTGSSDGSAETQARGYWTDPSTGLMWARKDNGKDVNWKNAVKYCRDLRLAGYSDWRLATLGELEGIYDKNANATGLSGPNNGPSTWHVKGNLFLTGYQWSSERRNDDRGHPTGYSWYFDFNDGKSNDQPSGFLYSPSFMRALCVRGSGK